MSQVMCGRLRDEMKVQMFRCPICYNSIHEFDALHNYYCNCFSVGNRLCVDDVDIVHYLFSSEFHYLFIILPITCGEVDNYDCSSVKATAHLSILGHWFHTMYPRHYGIPIKSD